MRVFRCAKRLALPCHIVVLDFPRTLGVTLGYDLQRAEGRAMDQRVYIAQLNITHFREKLLSANDGATRQRIARLLAEEEAKLAALSDPPGINKEDKC